MRASVGSTIRVLQMQAYLDIAGHSAAAQYGKLQPTPLN
jgi:hypothetical protein